MPARGLPPVLVTLLIIGVSALAVALLRRFAAALPVATPGERTLHERPIPRIGGLSIWAGYGAGLAAGGWLPPAGWAGLAGLTLVAGISLADDARGVRPAARLVVHAAAAGLLAAALPAPAGIASMLGVALAVAWSANLYNFMDGSDGLAAAMAIFGFGALGLGALAGGGAWLPTFAVALATLPFFAVNRPPASMFMGDIGAVPLGFLAAAMGWEGVSSGLWPAWFPLLAFLPFVADATVTLARRVLRGERVWEAHKTHYYQRLLRMGAGHRGTLALYAGLMAGCAGSAVAALLFRPGAGWVVLAGWIAAFGVLFAAIDYHWGKRHAGTR